MTTKHDNEVHERKVVRVYYSEDSLAIEPFIVDKVIHNERDKEQFVDEMKDFYDERVEFLSASYPSSDIKKAKEAIIECAMVYAACKHCDKLGVNLSVHWSWTLCAIYSTDHDCSKYCPANVCYGGCDYLNPSSKLEDFVKFLKDLEDHKMFYRSVRTTFLFMAHQDIQSVGKSE